MLSGLPTENLIRNYNEAAQVLLGNQDAGDMSLEEWHEDLFGVVLELKKRGLNFELKGCYKVSR